jgi:hypothetical protein
VKVSIQFLRNGPGVLHQSREDQKAYLQKFIPGINDAEIHEAREAAMKYQQIKDTSPEKSNELETAFQKCRMKVIQSKKTKKLLQYFIEDKDGCDKTMRSVLSTVLQDLTGPLPQRSERGDHELTGAGSEDVLKKVQQESILLEEQVHGHTRSTRAVSEGPLKVYRHSTLKPASQRVSYGPALNDKHLKITGMRDGHYEFLQLEDGSLLTKRGTTNSELSTGGKGKPKPIAVDPNADLSFAPRADEFNNGADGGPISESETKKQGDQLH